MIEEENEVLDPLVNECFDAGVVGKAEKFSFLNDSESDEEY